MYHSVTFGSKNTWDDWHLVSASRPKIAMPAVKSKWVDIPGTDGQMELYRRIYGVPLYENREGTLEFVVHDYGHRTWSELYSEIAMYLHGQPMTLVLEDDPDYYYEGVMSVGEWKSGAYASSISINYKLRPFKFEIDEDFPNWDPLDYDMNQATAAKTVSVSNETITSVKVLRRRVIPAFFCSSPMTVVHGSAEYKLDRGANRLTDIVLEKGDQSLTFKGNGKVLIDCRGGLL